MYEVELEDGRIIEFSSKPSNKDIEGALSIIDKNVKQRTSGSGEPSAVSKKYKNTFLEDVGSIGIRGANTALLGVPELIGNRINPEVSDELFRKPDSGIGKISDAATQFAAFVGGGAGRIGVGAGRLATKGIAKTFGKEFSEGLISRAMSGAVGGAVSGGSQITNPKATNEEILNRQKYQALGGALAGTALNSLSPVGKGIANISNVKSTSKATKISQEIRKEFLDVRKRAVDVFGNQLDELASKNPNRTVDISDEIVELMDDLKEMTTTSKNIIRKAPEIKNILDARGAETKIRNRMLKMKTQGTTYKKAEEAANSIGSHKTSFTVKEIQEIINKIKIPNKKDAGSFEALDFVNKLKASQLRAFPEMAQVRANYQKTIEPYNNVKNMFKFNKIMKAIESDFQGAEGKEAVKQLLSEETLKKIGGLQQAQKLLSGSQELIRNLIIGISSGVGSGAVFNQLYKK